MLIFNHLFSNAYFLSNHTSVKEPAIIIINGINLEFCQENPKSKKKSSNRFIKGESVIKLMNHSGLEWFRGIIAIKIIGLRDGEKVHEELFETNKNVSKTENPVILVEKNIVALNIKSLKFFISRIENMGNLKKILKIFLQKKIKWKL